MNTPLHTPAFHPSHASEGNFEEAWLALATVSAMHVGEELLTGFVPVWNNAAAALHEQFPWLLLPTFSFTGWLVAMLLFVAALFMLVPASHHGRRWFATVALLVSIVTGAWAAAHITVSVSTGHMTPGVITSPVLLAASLWAFIDAVHGVRRHAQ